MFEQIADWWHDLPGKKRNSIIGVILVIVFVLLFIVAIVLIKNDNNNSEGTEQIHTEQTESLSETDMIEDESITLPTETESEIETETQSETTVETESESSIPESESESQHTNTDIKEDPQQSIGGNMTEQNGSSVDIEDVVENLPDNETQELTIGIDVARYQGTIDWKQVADAGVDFAIIRVGYRTLQSGEIVADSNAKYNMQEATKYGIKVGVYFFSTAVSEAEAKEEADWVADYIDKYRITYPVAYNCEGYEDTENRQYGLTKSQRTDYAIAFLERISERGYSPMFYASKGEMEGDAKWETSRLESRYKIWVAQYPGQPYPQTAASSYSGTHDMWQYTNQGTVPGISKPVDMNVAYFGFRNEEGPQDTEEPEVVKPNEEALMNFTEVNEMVTAKERTNLRNKPSQGDDSTIMYTLKNGETATRTGISDSGWSRVIFNGETYYAVSSYLTTDLDYKPPTSETQPSESENGIKTQFTAVDELVTAKDAVNLRTLPSVEHEDSQVVVKIQHGDVIRRTGINTEVGWSRVEYNGQELYCISSYLMLAEDVEEE